MMLVFLICHMIGVSSACTNPILYGFLNENFVKEIGLLCPFLSKSANLDVNQSEKEKNGKMLSSQKMNPNTAPEQQMPGPSKPNQVQYKMIERNDQL